MTDRVLIVNADDFGRSAGVNAGVIRCHEEGIVTSATLMVRWPDATEAAAYARRRPSLGTGLHVDLGEWYYRDGEWHVRYEVVPTDAAEAVRAEVAAQVQRFEELLGRLPTHLDSHQHVHRESPVRDVVLDIARRLGVPVRSATPGVEYTGVFHGQDARGHPVHEAITPEALIAAIEALPPGVSELGCHPATAHDHDTTYGEERLREVQTLCDPRVRQAIERHGIRLRTYADVDPA